jgi:scyllo-inositol 2-dehydrogenase (NADP+)
VFHGPLLAANPQFDLAVIVTGNPDRQEAARRLYLGADVVATADEMLERDLDLVVVASPPATHVPLATAALGAGVAVVVDKPLCASAAEGAELVACAEAGGHPLTVFQNRRWDSDFLTLRRVIASGALGEVRQLESRFERWKPVPDTAKPWRLAGPDEAGGVVYDLGSHLIDQAIQLLGPVTDVHAELASYSGQAAPDDAFLSLRHAGGGVSRLWTSSVAGQPGPRFRVLGSEGAFVSWGLDPQEAQLTAGLAPDDPTYGLPAPQDWPVVGVSGATESVTPERGDYPAFYRGVADALLNGTRVPVDPRDSVEVIRILEVAHQGVTHIPTS